MERLTGRGDIHRLMMFVAATLSLFGFLILAVIAFAGWSSNETATQRERTLVENALNRAILRTLDEQKSVAWWDDSITNIREGAINLDFVDANFGIFLTETYSHDEVYILNSSDSPIYAYSAGERLEPSRFEDRRTAIAPVLALARGANATGLKERPDLFRERQTSYRQLAAPTRVARWAGRLLTVQGRPAVVAAMSIVPNVDMSLTPATPKLLVSVRYIDAGFVSDMGRSLLLPDLEIVAHNSAPAGMVDEPFVTDDGAQAGDLVWTTKKPGRALLEFILPMAAIGVFLTGLFFHGMFRSLKKSSSELAEREAQARHEAKHDALSGLPNRVFFVERLQEFLTRSAGGGRSKAIAAYLDVDRFKDVNDTLGHRAGDDLVRAIARRLKGRLRPEDFLARFGGDEFAILCEVDSVEGIEPLRERIKGAFQKPFAIEGQNILVTASVGLALAPDDGDEVDELMRNADIALYRAKAEGRDRAVLFCAEMAREVQERRMTELDLRNALKADELELHYQPIISCGTQQVIGVEALLRWNHPDRGNISPGHFIPIAEDAGLMPELGHWIMSQAMRDAARWPGLEVAVNLSPVQVRHVDLVNMLTRLVSRHGIDPARFILEITEGVLLDHSEHSLRTLAQIRELGFKTSLDDFGTGFSSLSYLCNFQFDKIKIDRSFVTGKAQSHTARTIVQAVATLGRGLNMTVVAEGVETEVDALLMKQLGCTEMQGFHFARPANARLTEQAIARLNAPAQDAPVLAPPAGQVSRLFGA
ncbi:MAG: EAL domain-containing protein [Hyphomonadaceae bacterium]|nr:EAL domain-containing protein [Hyphomonadaceae bacterium]